MTPGAPPPPFTAEHERLRSEMRAFVAGRLRPHADEWEAAGGFPDEVFRWVADVSPCRPSRSSAPRNRSGDIWRRGCAAS